ncbi:MAG: stress response protein, partial [bacterium]
TWGAIVEAKVGASLIEQAQMDAYLDLARDLDFDAVLSISNQLVTSSSDYPITVDRRKLRRVGLQHWSWVNVLTEAILQKEHRGVSDPDQAFILNELIRYLSDPRSGAVAFDSMGGSWPRVRDGARNGTLRKTDPEVGTVASRWDDLVRYLCLDLTKDLGRDVRQLLGKTERTPATRKGAIQEALASSGRLYAELQVPDAVGTIRLVADLQARQVIVSTGFEAPREGRSPGRLSWLLRQLPDAPEGLKIEAKVSRSRQVLAALLQDVREQPGLLHPESGKEISRFVLTLTRNMGLKRDAGRGSFIESVLDTTREFYSSVLQGLKAWKASPPKLKKAHDEEPSPDEGLPPPVHRAIERAEDEMDEATPSEHPTSKDA